MKIKRQKNKRDKENKKTRKIKLDSRNKFPI